MCTSAINYAVGSSLTIRPAGSFRRTRQQLFKTSWTSIPSFAHERGGMMHRECLVWDTKWDEESQAVLESEL